MYYIYDTALYSKYVKEEASKTTTDYIQNPPPAVVGSTRFPIDLAEGGL